MSKIYQKLIEAKKNFPAIIKNVSGFGYKYANLAQIIEAISEPLWAAKLDFYQNTKDNKMITGIVDTETGEKVDLVEFELMSVTMAKTNELQNFGAGITYLRRYSLQQAFGLASDDDDGATAKDVRKHDKPLAKQETPPTNELLQLLELKKEAVGNHYEKTLSAINSGKDLDKVFNWLKGL